MNAHSIVSVSDKHTLRHTNTPACLYHHLDSDTDNDDDWELFSCSTAKSTALFPQNKSTPEPSASVNDEDLSGAAPSAFGRKHQCSVCNKRFVTKHALQRHTRVHTGEKPFSCPACNRAFGQSDYLDRHMKIHSRDRPYSCSLCKETFAKENNLTAHMRTHTGEGVSDGAGKKHQCSVCNKRFGMKQVLQNHIRIHTGERPFSCSFCKV
uniref:C2H2-type domain-containing protein n=1 Tax=Neogobius melanostomus TaxID=47308 RepID=A0A8C6UGE7_9GOBI